MHLFFKDNLFLSFRDTKKSQDDVFPVQALDKERAGCGLSECVLFWRCGLTAAIDRKSVWEAHRRSNNDTKGTEHSLQFTLPQTCYLTQEVWVQTPLQHLKINPGKTRTANRSTRHTFWWKRRTKVQFNRSMPITPILITETAARIWTLKKNKVPNLFPDESHQEAGKRSPGASGRLMNSTGIVIKGLWPACILS